jgi:hypothetical protein
VSSRAIFKDPRAWYCAALVALGLAGFTGSSGWFGVQRDLLHEQAIRGEQREILFHSRPIRSDEWAVDLPLGRAQQVATPRFPLVNFNLGLGELQRNPYDVPVLDWGIAFRSWVWPLLVPYRWSLGVRWFMRQAIVAAGLFAWFAVVTRRRDRMGVSPDRATAIVAGLAALAVFHSSLFSWLTGHAVPEMIGGAGIVAWACDRAARAGSAAVRAGWLVAIAYGSACAFAPFYAPLWAPVLWILCGTAFDSHRPGRSLARTALATAPVVLAIAVGVAVVVAYYAPYVALVKDTVYPGRRLTVGGLMPWRRIVEMAWPSLHAAAPLHGYELYFGAPGGNVSESSSIEVPPLFLLAAISLLSRRVRGAIRRALAARPGLCAAWAVLASWAWLPVPGPLGWPALLRWSQPERTFIAVGVGTALLVAAVLSELAASPPEVVTRRRRVLDVAVAAVLVAGLAAWALAALPGAKRTFWFPILLQIALYLAAAAVIRTRVAALALAGAWVLPLVVADARVNPLLRSRDLFLEGAGHAVVHEAVRERPGRVVDFDTHPGAILGAHGWPVLGGVHTAPQPSLWRFLQPETGLGEDVWNRYAHVHFVIPPEPSKLIGGDVFQAAVSPCSPRLAALGVNHLLVSPEAALPPDCSAAFERRPAGSLALWSRRAPVGQVGVARGARPASALEFDWAAMAQPGARLEPGRDRLRFTAAGEESVHYAFAVNLAAVEQIACDGASATVVDTHVVVTPAGYGPVLCELRWLGSIGGLARLAGRAAAPLVVNTRALATTQQTP